MVMPSDVTIDLLSWVKAEIDHALKFVRESTATFLGKSDDASVLHDCPLQLHQVHGALRMVGLEGAAQVCTVIEHAFIAVLDGHNASKSTVSTIDRGVYALNQFLDDLGKGEPNIPLKLFPLYRDIAELHGGLKVSEKDLFFPDISVRTPLHPASTVVHDLDLAPYLRTQRARYQRGMLAWLRNAGEERGLREMQFALDAIDRIVAQLPAPRGLWWTAVGFIDALILSKDAAWLITSKPVCTRIDTHLRDLANQTGPGNELLFRDILYALANCEATSQRIKEAKSVFRLDSQFPEPALPGLMEYDLDSLRPTLDDLRTRLEAVKGAWVQYTSDDAQGLPLLKELVKKLKAKASDLGNQHLVRLLEVVVFVTARFPEKYPRQQYMIVEMVAAALMIEHILDTFTTPLTDLDEQVSIMAGWLLDAAKGKSKRGEPPPGLRSDLTQQISDIQLRAQVAKEIGVNLRRIEQALELIAREPGKRSSLGHTPLLLKQIHGALVLLRFEEADALLSVCSRLIVKCVRAGNANAAHDMEMVAEGLSSLELYLEPMLRGRRPAAHVIERFLVSFKADADGAAQAAALPTPRSEETAAPDGQKRRATDIPAVAEPLTSPPSAAATPAALAALAAATAPTIVRRELEVKPPYVVDEPTTIFNKRLEKELLGVFLEEAHEVLGNIGRSLPACQKEPRDFEALTTIRRAFHTLKGSGRMVGLDDLAEVAWEFEQLLNQWLERNATVTTELLDVIELAQLAFSSWVSELKAHGRAAVQGRELVARARELKSTMEPAVPVAHFAADARDEPPAAPLVRVIEAAPPVAVPEVVESTDEVVIGEAHISQGLYDVYVKEANEHLATLDREFAAWRDRGQSAVSHKFMRAVHTLASISRTTGLVEVAELAGALEQWLPYAGRVSEAPQMQAVESTLVKLSEMIACVACQQPPLGAASEVQALHELIAALTAATVKADEESRSNTQSQTVVIGNAIASARQHEQRVIQDDIDPQLLPVFLEEAAGLLPLIAQDLREWRSTPTNYSFCHALQRSLHTLKGSARMVGAMRLGELTHLLEGRVELALASETMPPMLFDEFEAEMDRLSTGVERLHHPVAVAVQEATPAVESATIEKAPEAPASPVALLRVQADTLDRLVNESGEISIARSRLEGELRIIKQSLRDLSDSVLRLRDQLRELEIQSDSQLQSRTSAPGEQSRGFDPLEFDRYTRLQELTRMMAETLHDITSVQQHLLKNIGEADAAIVHQARVNRDLQQELMRMRTVPFSALSERLYRIVRQSARDVGKKANLDIEGAHIELDRSVLEKLAAPLEHLVRNAIAHGLEAPAVRESSGKPVIGQINIALRQEGNEIVLIFSDDGAGIDIAKLKKKAISSGILQKDGQLSDAEAIELIFATGLSTADEVTGLAGRGVGLDVVRNDITGISGRIQVATEAGKQTTFTIFLPLTLAVTQAVLAQAGSQTFAISSAMVQQVLKVKPEILARYYEGGAVTAGDVSYPLHYLGRLLGQNIAPPASASHSSVLLLRSGLQRIAVHVDDLLKNQEIVVKHIGPQLARVQGIAGATVLGDGSIVLIINPVLLSQRPGIALPSPITVAPVVAEKPTSPTVMVVDDSLTVRTITGNLLEREGYRVTVAKDGIDALEKLKDVLPDIMLLDIEMPRMDGFDLTRSLRSERRTRAMPIIIISSRTADKHRRHALQLGVNAYLGKPYQEAELLEQIKSLLARDPANDLLARADPSSESPNLERSARRA